MEDFESTWTADQIRRVGHQAVDLLAEYLTALPNGPVFRPVPRNLAAELLAAPAPRGAESPDEILADFRRKISPYPFGNGHPRFWGWVNSPPAVMGIFAELLAAAMNPSCAGGNHAAVYIERQVLNWFKTLVGFPSESMGLLVSGGSMATVTALAVARHVKAGIPVRTQGLQRISSLLTVYTGAEGHSCVRKAVELLGIGSDQLRTIPVDSSQRISVGALQRAIRDDLRAGHKPIAVVATSGTVNTGAIDPISEISSLCREHGLWLHVDGSYGAPAILSERYRSALEPIRLADSIALDPHKWLYVPVEAGLVLVRDAAAMRDAFSLVPPYLRTDGNPEGVAGPPWFSEYGVQQTRGFRALKVWMCIKQHGWDGYAKAIERNIALADHLASRIKQSADLECVGTPGLSIVCFRYVPKALRGDEARLNALNKALLDEVQLSGQAFISSTVLEDRFALRACIVNPYSQAKDIDRLVSLVRSTGERQVARAG
jgi:glutamate/tyrosine decarboxylase-like PLP-dependent enzyme